MDYLASLFFLEGRSYWFINKKNKKKVPFFEIFRGVDCFFPTTENAARANKYANKVARPLKASIKKAISFGHKLFFWRKKKKMMQNVMKRKYMYYGK